MPRVVVPEAPHHVTQRGARRMRVFFDDGDYQLFRRILREETERLTVEIWAYCLMPNHVHLIAVPRDRTGLSRALARAHRRYARAVNFRHGWRGHLWQERFWSFPMDERHLHLAARYVLLNPVRAGLVGRATDWRFSSARAHLRGEFDELLSPGALDRRIGDWRRLLDPDEATSGAEVVRRHAASGRPLGDDGFVAALERRLGRTLRAPLPLGRRLAPLLGPPPDAVPARWRSG